MGLCRLWFLLSELQALSWEIGPCLLDVDSRFNARRYAHLFSEFLSGESH